MSYRKRKDSINMLGTPNIQSIRFNNLIDEFFLVHGFSINENTLGLSNSEFKESLLKEYNKYFKTRIEDKYKNWWIFTLIIIKKIFLTNRDYLGSKTIDFLLINSRELKTNELKKYANEINFQSYRDFLDYLKVRPCLVSTYKISSKTLNENSIDLAYYSLINNYINLKDILKNKRDLFDIEKFNDLYLNSKEDLLIEVFIVHVDRYFFHFHNQGSKEDFKKDIESLIDDFFKEYKVRNLDDTKKKDLNDIRVKLETLVFNIFYIK